MLTKKKVTRATLASLRDGQYVGDVSLEGEPDRDVERGGTRLSRIWSDWDEAGIYHAEISLERACTVYKDYAEGSARQERYMPDEIPHVTLPVIPSIVKQKVGTICQDPSRIEYLSNRSDRAGRAMTDFADRVCEEMGFQRKLKSAVRYALITPASFLHFYWDEDAIGRDAICKGAVRCERLTCLQVRVANEHEKNIQEQQWVIIATRERVKRVREACKDQSVRTEIQPDFADFDSDLADNGESYCTVLTRYFRIDGEVYFEKAVRGAMLCSPTPLNPNLYPIKEEPWRVMDGEHAKSPDMDVDGRNTSSDRNKFCFYPIEILVLNEQDNYYLGVSDCEDMIAGQNAINAMYSLAVLNGIDIQTKYVVKADALENQTITNEIGEVLVDHSRGSGQGISILTGQPQMTNQMLQLPLSLVETVRKLKSAADVTMGDVSKEYSATAISLLQTAAEKPTEDLTARKEEFVAACGRVLLMFLKFYYEDTRYMFRLHAKDRKEISDRFAIPFDKVPTRSEGVFNGADYVDDIFDVTVSVGKGGKVTQATTFAFLQTYYTQIVPTTTPQQRRSLIAGLPSNVLPDSARENLLDEIEEEINGVIAQLQQENAQLKAGMQKVIDGSKQMGTLINYQRQYIDEYQKQTGQSLATKDREIANLLAASQGDSAQTKNGNNGQKPVS